MKYIGIDFETEDASKLFDPNFPVWSLAVNDGKKIHLFKNCNGLTKKEIPHWVVDMLEDPAVGVIAQNAQYDMLVALLVFGIWITNPWCTQNVETVINGYVPPAKKRSKKTGKVEYTPAELKVQQKYGIALKFILPRYGFKSPDKDITMNFVNRPKGLIFTKEETDYMADDVRDLIRLRFLQEAVLKRDGLLEVALLENKTTEKIVAMRYRGITVDQKKWRAIAKESEKDYARRLAKLPKVVSNWGSEKQVKSYFKSRGIIIEKYNQLEEVLAYTKDPVLKDFIYSQEIRKAVTTYGMSWFTDGFFKHDDKVHAGVWQIVDTGRMSMFEPNLQQLPKIGLHRSAFVASPGNIFGIGDFSGQEIGIMAAAADEKLWIDAMLRGDDVHSLTASILYEAEWDNGYKKGCKFPKKCSCPIHMERRDDTKTLNFMLAYGGGPQKFSMKTGLTMWESKVVIKKYKKIVPNIYAMLEKNGGEALDKGETYSADPYLRRRMLPYNPDKEWHTINQGKNSPIQMAGANMLKLAMISLPDSIPTVLVIHDEIITEPRIKDGIKNNKILKSVMEKSADYITGIKGLIKVEPRLSYNLAKQ